MPTYHDEDEYEPEEDFDESEHPDAEDADWNLDPSTQACPHCGKEISEDAQRCPHCGTYISEEDAPPKRRGWIVALILVLILVSIFWAFRGW
ncbi:MAG: hypothetical protein JWP03_4251 [Phycisphaerales bacterium]|nr:hypothetical protein [Phycisphaerales bacterium]